MIPQRLYERLPLVYGLTAVVAASLIDRPLAWASASLMWAMAMLILYRRYRARRHIIG